MSVRPDLISAPGTRLRGLLSGGLVAATLAVAATAGAATLAVPAQAEGARQVAAAAPKPTPSPTPVPPSTSDITMVQANIYTGLTVPRFQADVATVLSMRPDFVTYNEVPFRVDEVMAPAGYDIYRDTRDRFTAATPVAWREDRWTDIDHGVFRISNWRGKPPGRVVEIGRRYANWVTLQGVDGRTVSVVSVHVAPLDKNMPDLLRGSVTRLGVLTDRLAAAGPVLVGGDFNVHYTSGRYPRDLLAPKGLVPTFDTLGNYFPTGDHQGATIDYVYNRGAGLLTADQHFPVELRSDHDAVVAGFSWAGDLPSETVLVRSDPAGNRAARLSALRTLKNGINAAPAGSTLRLVTSTLDLYAVRTRLVAAAQRGVAVKVSIVGNKPTAPAVALRDQLRSQASGTSSLRRCTNTCATEWRAGYRSPTLLLVGDASGAWTTRFDVSRTMTSDVVTQPTQVSRSVGAYALSEADELVAGLRQRAG